VFVRVAGYSQTDYAQKYGSYVCIKLMINIYIKLFVIHNRSQK
ncbi:uncharacterized protein METZ01_LOCUS93081, partial [marine metagenome]